MKKQTMACAMGCALIMMCFISLLRAEMPELKREGQILNVVVPYCAAPDCVDWNNDGAKDLVVGQETDGNIRLFLNEGTDLDPKFTQYSLIMSNGVPISVPWT